MVTLKERAHVQLGKIGTRGPIRASALALTFLAFAPISEAHAQCAGGWVPNEGVPGLDNTPFAMHMWDRDGAGPLPPLLVAAGRFNHAGGVPASKVAAWNPATNAWSAFGAGMNDYVLALASMPNGSGGNDLIASGGFFQADGAPAGGIARWNGTSWSAIGFGNDVRDTYALAVLPGNTLVIGGTFLFVNQNLAVLANHVARWDGANWQAFGTGMNNHVLALAVLPGGDLVAGGYFTTAGSNPANYIARWNGASWSPLGAGTDGPVFALALLPSGDLVVVGNFNNAGGAPASKVAKWSSPGGAGGTWSAFGSGVNFETRAIAVLPSAPGTEDFVVGGQFTIAGGSPASRIARWTRVGAAPGKWSALGSGLDSDVRALATLTGPAHAGDFVVGGNFDTAGGVASVRFARYGINACPGDLTCDGQVDDSDFLDFVLAYNVLDCADPAMPAGCPADLNGDGFVDDADFIVFVAAYNALVCP